MNVDSFFVNVFIGDSEEAFAYLVLILDIFEQLLLTGKYHQNLNLVFTIQVSLKINWFVIFQPNVP